MNAFLRLLLCFILLSLSQLGYPYVLVKGRLASATDDTPLAGATVRLLSFPDSTLLIGSYSDKEGNFSIASSKVTAKNAKNPVKIIFVASYIGYQTANKVIIVRPKEKEYDLKDVYLQEDTRILGEALVSATPPPLLIKEDTVEYYADSYKTQPDATAEDLLKRLPGVEVASDGTITAQGETVQQVYVDGKEFFGSNIQATTKNITADMIESVQVVDMKTEEARLTGIDDGERRKVMNFKLKPKMRRGWFGNGAVGWGMGHDIDDRFYTRGMVGYFRGNNQNALVFSANNTNNAGFGDLGDGVMNGSAMRGNRQSGRRGDGINTSWSIGLNMNYDEGNRMRDQNTPLAMGGNMLYGGSTQDEMSRTHRVNLIMDSTNVLSKRTEVDSYNQGYNESQNLQLGLKYEKSWGTMEHGQHRLQFNTNFSYNSTETDDYSESHNFRLSDSIYTTQSQSRSEMMQKGFSVSVGSTYSYTRRTDRGRRRASITVNVSERLSDGDRYLRSNTSRGTERIDFDPYQDIHNIVHVGRGSSINQWNNEESHNENYRLRLTYVEPLSKQQFLELSATANLSNRRGTQDYQFWDGSAWVDSIGNIVDTDYNSDTWNRNINYTLTASYRLTSQTYNMNVGLDFLPQNQRYRDYCDPSRNYDRNYMNYAPRLEYRYNWTRRTNLRITLNGRTSQPSQNQLQARKNQTSSTHVSLGNPDLKPSFSTHFDARFRTFNDQTYVTLEAGLNASASFNNLVTKRWYTSDLSCDTTQTVNLSGVGNWTMNGNFRGSWPFYDNMWYVTSNTSFGYRESDGYSSQKKVNAPLNTTRSYSGSEQAGIAYRSEKFNMEVRGNYRVQYSEATQNSNNLGTIHNFGVSSNLTAYLPFSLILSSDFNYTARRGYSAAMSRNQNIWNAQLSRTFLEKKNLTAFVKVFDILRQRSSITHDVSAESITDRETSVLGQYFLLGASIKFNQMGQHGGGARRRQPGNNYGTPMGGGENYRDDIF